MQESCITFALTGSAMSTPGRSSTDKAPRTVSTDYLSFSAGGSAGKTSCVQGMIGVHLTGCLESSIQSDGNLNSRGCKDVQSGGSAVFRDLTGAEGA